MDFNIYLYSIAVYLSICLHKINMQKSNTANRKIAIYINIVQICILPVAFWDIGSVLDFYFAVSPVGIEIETLSAIDRYFNLPINNN